MEEILRSLEQNDNLRRLTTTLTLGKYIEHDGQGYINMSSNDYLGIGSSDLQDGFQEWLTETLPKLYGSSAGTGRPANQAEHKASHHIPGIRTNNGRQPFYESGRHTRLWMSNPSSRLMTGNSPEYDLLENTLSDMYGSRGILVLGSGYHANTGVLPALTDKRDLIIADKLIHASLIDALRLSDADHRRFAHNDLGHLETIISQNRDKYRNIWVVTESVFSMDGDRADLAALCELKKRYDVKLYLDEAHGFGVFGLRGEGLAAEMGIADRFDIIICTLGKAMASAGAFVVCDTLTREVLVNRMRPLIFSTALPPVNLLWTLYLLHRQDELSLRRQRLRRIISELNDDPAATQIMPIMAGDNHAAVKMAEKFHEDGFWVTPIRYPTVPQGAARVRISLNAGLGDDDITKFRELCSRIG